MYLSASLAQPSIVPKMLAVTNTGTTAVATMSFDDGLSLRTAGLFWRSPWPSPEESTGMLILQIKQWFCWDVLPGSPADRSLRREDINEALVNNLSKDEPGPIGLWNWFYWMVGKSQETANPTIIFCHGFHKRIRDKARNIIKEHVTLAPGVRVNSLNQGPRLFAGTEASTAATSPDTTQYIVYRSLSSQNPCGARIAILSDRFLAPRPVTLGGILLVEKRIYGLTVNHVFQNEMPISRDDENILAFDEDLDAASHLDSTCSRRLMIIYGN